MRKIAVVVVAPVLVGAALVGAARAWRRHPRVGTVFVNTVVNPALVRRGLTGGGRSELGTLEHVGRRSGMVRLTPVHPEPTPNGFRILVPLGMQSEWARNVLAAGRCRMELHDQVFALEQPVMIDAGAAAGLPGPVRRVMAALEFKYLDMRVASAGPGSLADLAAVAVAS